MVNRSDRVWFDSSTEDSAAIYQTDEFGRRIRTLFQPQEHSVNYYMKEFLDLGVYYFSTDINDTNDKKANTSSQPLVVIVIPEIQFHYKSIRKNVFDSESTMANINDFIIWRFEESISRSIVQLNSDDTFEDLENCHEVAIVGRNRLCLGVECVQAGTVYVASPGKTTMLII